MTFDPYVLLVATGQSPQVITETIWSLSGKRSAFDSAAPDGAPETQRPDAVHVVTTALGEAYARAMLLGEPAIDPLRDQPIQAVADRWTPFFEDVFGTEPPPLHTHVPSEDGEKPLDIRTPDDDFRYARLCYDLVAELTTPEAPPLYGSIAGGRRTMSSHLMTAFCLCARLGDRLVHVFVNPPSYERDPNFFYPTDDVRDKVRLFRIDVKFPRLREVLNREIVSGLPMDRRDLEGILNALQPYNVLSRTPTHIQLHFDDEPVVHLADGHETLGTCHLRPSEASTLVVLANAMQGEGGPVPIERLHAGTDLDAIAPSRLEVNRQRSFIDIELSGKFDPDEPWMDREDVSKAISRLNRSLRDVPIAAKHLRIEGQRVETSDGGHTTAYYWKRELPCPLQISTRHPPGTWPFDHLPPPSPSPSRSM
jgi:CRISPR-associated protein (TIGR02584 family)